MVGMKGKSFPRGDFGRVLMQYDDLAGAAHEQHRGPASASSTRTASTRSWRSRTRVLALFHYPDKALRERVFRIYNEYIADLQERSQRPLLRRRPDQLVGLRRAPAARWTS